MPVDLVSFFLSFVNPFSNKCACLWEAKVYRVSALLVAVRNELPPTVSAGLGQERGVALPVVE